MLYIILTADYMIVLNQNMHDQSTIPSPASTFPPPQKKEKNNNNNTFNNLPP